MSNFIITLLFGCFGVHKFMQKKPGIGVLYLFTMGLFGIGWIYDCIVAFFQIGKPNAATYVRHGSYVLSQNFNDQIGSCFDYAQSRGIDISTRPAVLSIEHLRSIYDADLTHYQISACNDERVCPYCRKQDGRIYPVASAKMGVNLPPFHNECRCTIVGYFND